MSGRHYAAEDRKPVEDTHLATARRQWEGNGISGTVKMAMDRLFFIIVIFGDGRLGNDVSVSERKFGITDWGNS